MTTATIVRQARTAAGYSQQSLAMACGLSKRTIQNIEAGGSPTSETVMALRSVLGVDIPLEDRAVSASPEAEIQLLAMARKFHESGDRVLGALYRIEMARTMITGFLVVVATTIGLVSVSSSSWNGAIAIFVTLGVALATHVSGNREHARIRSEGFAEIEPGAEMLMTAVERGDLRRISGDALRIAKQVLGQARVDAAMIAAPGGCEIVRC